MSRAAFTDKEQQQQSYALPLLPILPVALIHTTNSQLRLVLPLLPSAYHDDIARFAECAVQQSYSVVLAFPPSRLQYTYSVFDYVDRHSQHCRPSTRLMHDLFHSHSPLVPRPVHRHTCSIHLAIARLLLLLLALLCALPPARSADVRQQHNVWYNGLQITGIAVDESSGDVFFSDAANNRVVRQAANGSVLDIYRSSFYSPMQLSYYNGTLYVADSHNNRVVLIDVNNNGHIAASTSSPYLSSCSALSYNPLTGSLYAIDGWGLTMQVLVPDSGGGKWKERTDLQNGVPPPDYIASVSVHTMGPGHAELWMTSPTQQHYYDFYDEEPVLYIDTPTIGRTAIQYVNDTDTGLYILSQTAVDQRMDITLLALNGTILSNWTAKGRGGKPVPFIGWAMHVDSRGNMYISDHGVDEQHSPHGRVVKIAPNGTELAQWSMSDGTAYSPSSIWYDDTTLAGGSCAYWMTDSERGVMRVAADGSVLQQLYAAPVDPADGRTARFTGMTERTAGGSDGYMLLDASDPSTTKLWHFWPIWDHFILLNTSTARLGPNITGIAVSLFSYNIFVSDTRTRTVLCLLPNGSLDTTYNLSRVGFVEPAGLFVRADTNDLFVADSGYNGAGAVLIVDSTFDSLEYVVSGGTTPAMYRPVTVTFDPVNQYLYTGDSNGYLFQFNSRSRPAYSWVQTHRPIPAVNYIASMTISARGNLYMLDAHSRRLIILAWDMTGWDLGNDCVPSVLPSSSSSSSSLPTSPPSHGPQHSSTSSWQLSSSASSIPTPHPLWSASTVLGVAVVGGVAALMGTTCLCVRWKSRLRRRWRRSSKEAAERLMEEQQQQQQQQQTEDGDEDGQEEADDVDVEEDEQGQDAVAARVVGAVRELWQPVSTAVPYPTPQWADAEPAEDASNARFQYYVARYEVVAAVSDMPRLHDWEPVQARRSIGPSLSIHIPQLSNTSSAPSISTHSTSSIISSSSSSTSNDYSTSAPTPTSGTPTQPSSDGRSGPLLTSPTHIARLHSAWRTTPTFIDSVSDLVILGEGSSGVVYRGMYGSIACVVKLPKSASLTGAGAAWREWQYHLSLPAHPSLVRFLGALPMSATNYLVLRFVRQGSLHSLLTSSTATSSLWYRRPYGVMRCMRDMSSVLRHIHVAGVVHRDVSCRNILMDSDGRSVLADLGLAAQHTATTTAAGSSEPPAATATVALEEKSTAVPVRWTSPEALASSQRYDSKSDVWSLGVALWECTAGGALPYGELSVSTKECIRPIIAGQWRLQVDGEWGRSEDMSEAERQLAVRVRAVIALCLTYDWQQRPDSEQLMAVVEREWQQWQAEAGDAAKRLAGEWESYHAEVQRRLGAPTEHSESSTGVAVHDVT